jgi:protein gp37
MGDLFHKDVPDGFLNQVFEVMESAPQHIFQVLTKRADRMKNYLKHRWKFYPGLNVTDGAPDHIWIGVTAENQERANERIPVLLDTPAKKRFVSIEPYLQKITLTWLVYENMVAINALTGEGGWPIPHEVCGRKLDWVIVGAESGPGARGMDLDWVRSLRDECVGEEIPFFFKQQIVNGKKVKMPELDGKIWDQYPKVIRPETLLINIFKKEAQG